MKLYRLTDERLAAIRRRTAKYKDKPYLEHSGSDSVSDRGLLLAEMDHHRETLRYVLDVIDSGMAWTESRLDMLREREPWLFGDDVWDHDGGRPRNPDLLAAAAAAVEDAMSLECKKCGQPIEGWFVTKMVELSEKSGRRRVVPEICHVCLWKALENVGEEADD